MNPTQKIEHNFVVLDTAGDYGAQVKKLKELLDGKGMVIRADAAGTTIVYIIASLIENASGIETLASGIQLQ